MNEKQYQAMLNELRKLYVERNFTELKKKYYLSRWLIKKEDREKIEKVVYLSQETDILELAQKQMGGKISPIDK